MKTKTWQWYLMTNGGIYTGSLTGTPEDGETEVDCFNQVAVHAVEMIKKAVPDAEPIATFISEHEVFIKIEKPGPVHLMDLEEKFTDVREIAAAADSDSDTVL